MYIALSNMKRWSLSDNLFFLDEFYDNIVSMFEDNVESAWVEETLEWWNRHVFAYFVEVLLSPFSQENSRLGAGQGHDL